MSSLELQGISKRFGRNQALQNLSLSVKDGEFMVLLGPTAAGKTTSLRCVAGLEKLDSGSVRMDEQVVNKLNPAERDMAFVFQTYALYPRKTAYENMAFPLEARNLPPKEINARVREVAELLRISELLNRRPVQMSGGQQQRVALGRAMVRQPRVFLMDEPLTNLDFTLRVEMRSELKRLQRELAATFFYVTNDQVEAMSMADRIAVLNKGVLQQVDTPETIYNQPANLFVAQFVGSPRINSTICSYDSYYGNLQTEDGAWTFTLSPSQREIVMRANSPQKLIFGIRSEDIQISHQAQENAYQGKVYIIEPLGDRTYVDVEIGKFMLKVRASADFEAKSGDTVYLKFDNERVHLFEAETGKTIF